ncbi:MAG: phytanoyl-CoA dioxygenase family protein [Planctomycetota bacterium]
MTETNKTLTDVPWLDRPDAIEQIAAKRAKGELTDREATILESYSRDGFVNLGRLVEPEHCREMRDDVSAFLKAHIHLPQHEWLDQLQNRYIHNDACRRATLLPSLIRWCDLVLGTRALPFQTLSLPEGTQILPHTDQILMSTQPMGYLVVAWLALEDIHPDAGPLTLWKGSHRLPYVRPLDLGIAPGTPRPVAEKLHNEHYYSAIQRVIDASNCEPFVYLPKEGEVLLWHSNVVHRGALRVSPTRTRHSLVIHYFGEGSLAFSDLFSEPCVLPGLR